MFLTSLPLRRTGLVGQLADLKRFGRVTTLKKRRVCLSCDFRLLESSRILHSDIVRDDWFENISFSPNCECPVAFGARRAILAATSLVALLAVASAVAVAIIVIVAFALLEIGLVFFRRKIFAFERRAL